MEALGRETVVAEHEVVQPLDVAIDEVRPFVEVGVVETVADPFQHERRLLDVDDRVLDTGETPVNQRRMAYANQPGTQ